MLNGTPILLIIGICLHCANASLGPCEVETGQSSIIVDIEESRDKQVNQSTTPEILPIYGTPDQDVTLTTIFPKGRTLFTLEGKKLKLLEPLDRDADNLSHIVFQLICIVKSTKKRRTIPVIVRVSDINDNPPRFQNTPYETSISELTPVGTTVFDRIKAFDPDAGVNGLAEYFIIPWDNITKAEHENGEYEDGYGYFSINLPHQGQVTLNKSLDYEKTQKYLVNIIASDRARRVKERYTTSTKLVINVLDGDDQDPSFIYKGCMLHEGACINPEYSSSVNSGILSGFLNISPEKIQAVDMDTLDSPIRYSILEGTPDNWDKFFAIDSHTAAVRQIQPIDTSTAKRIELVIKAEEQTEQRRYTTAKLTIVVKPVDANPPVVVVSSNEGHVVENSPKGTRVLDQEEEPIRFDVTDADLSANDPKPNYTFELTTNYFDIDQNNILVVNNENLDRDPPNPGVFRFQVVCREANGGAASAPISLTVKLIDVNDNAPVIHRINTLSVPASDQPMTIYKVEASDIDEGENAYIIYSILHVSNNGGELFKIGPSSGVIESTSALNAGSRYSITVRATDAGGLWSQVIVELHVAPGPNKRPPIFSARDYSAHLSEGAALNSTVTTVTAKDPENEPVTYSIVSGNDLRQFSIGSNTGIITVIRKLDREDLTRYQLLIKAEDPGKLSSTSTVNIKVTDINDNNPEFDNETYSFSVIEGVNDAFVGRVHANDADEGINAIVHYSLPQNVPFKIDNVTGDIRTKVQLDYETQKMYEVVVTARDGGGTSGSRIGTATVKVAVQDARDEKPYFETPYRKVTVDENQAGYLVATIEAKDPDTIKEITYTLKQGDLDLFSLNRKTGAIRTLRPLDRETAAKHVLIIGIEENGSDDKNATTVLEVYVQDKNDNSPIFTTIPEPVTIEDSTSIGTAVATLLATDGDATSPNNLVRYQMAGRGKASKYFQVDTDTGVVRVRDLLTKEADTEYTVDVRAYDQGEPQLSNVVSLTVYVSHITTVPPEVGLGFADNTYTEHVSEIAKNGTLIREFKLVNKRDHPEEVPIVCTIISGNEEGMFVMVVTNERNCALYLNKSSLDYEILKEYTLEIKLESIEGIVSMRNSRAKVKIHVTDENDNSPVFKFPDQSNIATAREKYYAIVTPETLLDTNVIQVKAKDKDSGEFGKIEYQKHNWKKNDEDYFTLDSDTGIIRNIKTFESVNANVLPFTLTVIARDNPKSTNGYNIARATVVINLLKKENQLVMEVTTIKADDLRRQTRSLLRVLESRSGLVVGIEKFTARYFIGDNNTLEADGNGADIWFYVIDPKSGVILRRDSEVVRSSIASETMRAAVSESLSSSVSAARGPLIAPTSGKPNTTTANAAGGWAVWAALPAALLALACVVLLAATLSLVYICTSWSRYKKFKERTSHYGTIMPSPIARPISYDLPDPSDDGDTDNIPKYETQVLNMSLQDDADLQIDFSMNNNHAFNIDNVSYLTKGEGRSPTVSHADTATTLRASSIVGSTATIGRHKPSNILNNSITTLPRAPASIAKIDKRHRHHGAIMAYDNNIPGTDMHRASDNDNVTFAKRNFTNYSYPYMGDMTAVETTTEL